MANPLFDLQVSLDGVQGYKFNETSGTTVADIPGGTHDGTYRSGVVLGHDSIVPTTSDTCITNGSLVNATALSSRTTMVPWYSTQSTIAISFAFSILKETHTIGAINLVSLNGSSPQNSFVFQSTESRGWYSYAYFAGQGQSYHADYPSDGYDFIIGESYFVVMNFTGTKYDLYINGEQVFSDNFAHTFSSTNTPSSGIDLLNSGAAADNAAMQNFMIHGRSLTPTEITNLYTTFSTSPANPATTSLDSASVSYVGDPRTDWVLDFELSANQADCTFEYQLDEGSWTACDATDSITGSDFVEHSIIFRSTNPDDDIESPGTDPYVFTPDNVKPSISVDSFVVTPPVSPDVETTIDFELSSDDEDAIFEYNFNEIGWVTCSATDSYTDELVPATYTMYFHAIDDSGYISEQAFQTFTVEDTDTYYPNYRRRQQQTRVRWS